MAAREERPDRVAKSHCDDGQSREQLSVRLIADEQCDADEPDAEPDQPEASDPRLAEEREREQRVEDRNGSLDDRREPGVDPRLAPGEEPERHRRVHEPYDDEPAPAVAQLGERPRGAELEDRDPGEQQSGRPEAGEDQGRRRKLPVGDLDQHERRAPDEREQHEDDDRPTHLLSGTQRSRVALDSVAARARLSHLSEVVAQPVHRALGLTDWEADRIRELLGRDPNHFELAVFSLLWSEHCGYKHSAPLLKRLPSAGERVLQGPGENAGVLDLGDGTAVAFKGESHNHPSAVEPFQGAATGVGGILRDIIAMGARPVALLDGLRFGAPDHAFDRAVAGIGHYGNCVGVPTVGGQTVFDPAYASNCLVNAMCVGLADSDRLRSARASGPGRLVVLYGATTGRDGIGGASVLASAELSEDDADKRPSVQVGDPFTGKKLIEVSLELVESGLVESLQDCGAAGLASSLSEMAGGDAGIDVELDRVPLREEDMEPWEIMISESQERMVAVVRPEMLDAVSAVCERWELACTPIGEVTDTGELRAFHDGDVVGEIPAELL